MEKNIKNLQKDSQKTVPKSKGSVYSREQKLPHIDALMKEDLQCQK